MSHQYETMPRSSSCNYPASRNVQKSPRSFDNVEPMSLNVRRASAITVVQYQPPTPSTAVDYSTTPSVSDEMQPGSYFHRRRGSTTSQGVSRSNSGSSTSTAAPSPTLRSTFPKHVNSLFHHAHRRLHMPLRRNHTTKTVSQNDLMSDDSGQLCERALRSISFAEMPAYQQSIPMHPTSMRFSTDMPSPKSPAYAARIADASAPTALVESVRVDLDGNGDVRIATRLVPRVHNSAGVQMAYLPPRTSTLTVTNVH
ncbi:hypothetical protein J3F80_002570 [Coemansia sp. RSA 2526]|nr:hypothetical protein J3F80_002570 [Coemansia sp. RSA 2526]